MRLALLSGPSAQPVTLAEMKAYLRIEHDGDDTVIEALLATATGVLDGRRGLLGRFLLSQSWQLSLDGFTSAIELPFPPCISVDEVRFTNPAGIDTVLDPAGYTVIGLEDDDGATIRPNTRWPSSTYGLHAVRVAFTAGYGDAAEAVPEDLRTAIKMHVSHLYDHRDGVANGTDRGRPPGWADLVFPYRVAGV